MKVKFGFLIEELRSVGITNPGTDFVSASIKSWTKKPGEAVFEGELLAEVETDKVTSELNSPCLGVISSILYGADDMWELGATKDGVELKERSEDTPFGKILLPELGYIEITVNTEKDTNAGKEPEKEFPKGENQVEIENQNTEASSDSPKSESGVGPRGRFTPVAWNIVNDHGLDPSSVIDAFDGEGKIGKDFVNSFIDKLTGAPKVIKDGIIPAVPAARRLMQDEGINPAFVEHSGGAIILQDVKKYKTSQVEALFAVEDRVALGASQLRKTIARFMQKSHLEIPQYGGSLLIDVSKLREFREKAKTMWRHLFPQTTLRYDYIFGFLSARLLKLPQFSILNGYWDKEKADAYLFNKVNLGFAAETGPTSRDPFGGLMVPVVHEADKMSFAELVHSAEEKLAKIRAGKITLADLNNLTFTINNVGGERSIETDSLIEFVEKGGVFGDSGISHSAIPYTNDTVAGERPTGMIFIIGSMFWHDGRVNMWVSFRFDHRLTDGGPPRRFVSALKKYIENKKSADDFMELFEPDFSLK